MKYLEDISVKNLEHLGIVAGIIDEIGIGEKINELIGTDDREKVNAGEVVKAIIFSLIIVENIIYYQIAKLLALLLRSGLKSN